MLGPPNKEGAIRLELPMGRRVVVKEPALVSAVAHMSSSMTSGRMPAWAIHLREARGRIMASPPNLRNVGARVGDRGESVNEDVSLLRTSTTRRTPTAP